MTVDLSQSGREEPHDAIEDGRHLRRQRNRDAALDALISLIEEGQVSPSVADVAARAGVSQRSFFRYFDDVADFSREAIARMNATYLPDVAGLEVDASLPLEQRIETTAVVLDRVYRKVLNGALASRVNASRAPEIVDQMVAARLLVRSIVERSFAPELNACDPADRPTLLALIDVWCTFETQHVLHTQGAVEGTDPVQVTAAGMAAVLGQYA